MLSLELSDVRNRGILVATVNAVLQALGYRPSVPSWTLNVPGTRAGNIMRP